MKTINLKSVVVLGVMAAIFLAACDSFLDKQEDIQKTTVTASAVINVPKGSALLRAVSSLDEDRKSVV
jgi:hypothetical protein